MKVAGRAFEPGAPPASGHGSRGKRRTRAPRARRQAGNEQGSESQRSESSKATIPAPGRERSTPTSPCRFLTALPPASTENMPLLFHPSSRPGFAVATFAVAGVLAAFIVKRELTPHTQPAALPAAAPNTPQANAPPTEARSSGIVAPGTEYATPWRAVLGTESGPHVVVEAGLHGDEIAGILAVDDLSNRLHLSSGQVTFLPRMNRPACDAGTRSINTDLNLVFPGDFHAPDYEHQLSAHLMRWMGEQRPDVVITLHESRYLYDGKNPKTFGQTVVYGVQPMPDIVSRVLDHANRTAQEPRERFRSNYFPIATSSTEQFVAAYGTLGLCLETWRGLALEARVRRQEDFVFALFDELYQLSVITPRKGVPLATSGTWSALGLGRGCFPCGRTATRSPS